MADKRRVYVDSCCFVDMVKTSVGKMLAEDKENDVWFLKRLLEAGRDDEVNIYTLTLTIAECRHAGDDDISDQVKSQFNRILLSGQYVKLVQMTPFIAQDARDLRWQHNIAGLRGADSIHVASAIALRCEELLSGDKKLERIGSKAGELSRFGLVARRAKDTICLPAKYRQLELNDGETRN